MPSASRSTTLGQHVYERLRADLLQGHFTPRSPLRLAGLTDRYGTSMTVVREALVRLTEQHLVDLVPNAGFRMSAVSRDDLLDLTDLRVDLEGRAVRQSVEKGDLAWEAALVSSHHVLESTPFRRAEEPGTTEAWAAAHAGFHEALIAACGSPRLLHLTRSLRDSAELYRQLSETGTVTAHRDVAQEHRELLDLAIARRSAEAAHSLERHLRFTTELILATVLAEPEPEEGEGVGEH